jgi:transcriptional regulator with XRE-family HTH domain
MAELTIGEGIRELRKRAALTQYDLAVAAEVSVHTIRQLEQGRRQTASIATLVRLARALGVDLAELLGRPSAARLLVSPGCRWWLSGTHWRGLMTCSVS